ncbi:hypothetical protein [Piscinibacter sp. XHJ-5]|uniref:hypothetical protein n=1 Tax=Piscinibacter sp. XHJ-5 TaxID=3037797 RepID=UPI002452E257|nr:hypothetical protein [Piscinibacter sp. XHJ-5]
MSELSEAAYRAGWIENLEHSLWQAVVQGPFRFGRLDLNAEHVAKLKRLAKACEGWICFDDSDEETFVDLQWWLAHGYKPELAAPGA